MNKKCDKNVELDDRTVSDMSAEWMPWNRIGPFQWRRGRKEKKDGNLKMKKKEFRAAVLGQYLAMLPMFICVIAAFGLMYFLLKLWLSP